MTTLFSVLNALCHLIVLIVLLIAFGVFLRHIWRHLVRLYRWARVPEGAIFCWANHDGDILAVGDRVTVRGRTADGVVFQADRIVATITDTGIRFDTPDDGDDES